MDIYTESKGKIVCLTSGERKTLYTTNTILGTKKMFYSSASQTNYGNGQDLVYFSFFYP